MRILALDVSKKRIGFAIGNTETRVATPLGIITRIKLLKDIENLQVIIAEYDIGQLVIGLPLNMDGTEGSAAQSIRQFGRNIAKGTGLPVIFHDERLTTSEAKDLMAASGAGSNKIKSENDHMAAAIILQSYLDSTAV